MARARAVKLTLGWVFGVVRLVVGLALLGTIIGAVVTVANVVTKRSGLL